MLKQITIGLVLMTSTLAFAQVGIQTQTPHASADLELGSNDKALLINRVANTGTVTNPANGMMVYDISSHCIKGYENGAWTSCYSASGNGSGGNIDIGVGQTAFYVRKVPCTPAQYMSSYFTDVPVIEGLRLDAYGVDGTGTTSRYDPRLINTTENPIRVNYTAIASGDNNTVSSNKTIAAGAYETVDGGSYVWAGTQRSETETIDLMVNGKWFRILYFAYIDSADNTGVNATSLRTIRISITRLQ